MAKEDEVEVVEEQEGAFEIVEEAEPEKPAQDDTVDKLKQLYEEQQQRLQGSQEEVQNVRGELSQGFEKLSESLKGLAQAQTLKPGESYEEFKARVEKSIFDKPIEAMDEVLLKRQGPLNEQIVTNQFRLGKKIVLYGLDEVEKPVFKKYEKEVDAEFSSIPVQERFADPEAAYEKAFNLVKVKHLKEILEAQKPKVEPAAPYGMVEGVARAPQTTQTTPAGTKRIVLTPQKKARIEAMMARENVDPKMFPQIVESLHEQGMLDRM